MTLKDNKRNVLWQYLLPPFIVAAILLTVLAIKGVYPFGELSLVTYDMGYGDLPSLIYLNDVIHGEAGLVFNWRILGGMEGVMLGSFLDPINVFLALFPREQMLDFASFWIVLKITAVAACAFPFFKKSFSSLPYYFQLIFTLLYALGSFNLRYCLNPGFLNFAALLPLLVLAVFKLFNEKKYLPFILCLSYILITSVYFAFFFVLFLIIIGAFYIYSFFDKDNRGKMAFRLGVGTGCSLLISASTFLPSLGTLLSGSRFVNAVGEGVSASAEATANADTSAALSVFGKFKEIYLSENNFDFNKIFMLAGIEFAVVLLFVLLFKIKKDKKHVLFFAFSGVLFLLPIVFENINLIWHGGSYSEYSMRYGFMLIFMFLCGAAYYLTEFDSLRDGSEKNIVLKYLKPALVVVAAIVSIALYSVNMQNGADSDVFTYTSKAFGFSLIKTYLMFFAAVAVMYLIILTVKNKSFRRVLLSVSMCTVLLANSFYIFAAVTVDKENCHISYLAQSTLVSEEVKNDNGLQRINNYNANMFTNYPYALMRSSATGWNHSITPEIKSAYSELGYSNSYTLIFDSGATPFTGSLLGANEYIANTKMDEKLYSYNKKLSNGYYLYNSKYSLPFGVLFNDSINSIGDGEDIFIHQNDIARSIIGVNNSLFEKADCEINSYEKTVTKDSVFENAEGVINIVMPVKEYTFNLKENQVLYMAYNDADGFVSDTAIYSSFKAFVNGSEVILPGYDDAENTMYPSQNYNGTVMLTDGKAGEYKVEVDSLIENADFSKLVFYTMDISSLESICASAQSAVTDYSTGKSSVSITLDGTKSGLMFIPLNYSDNWECLIDGERAETEKVLGTFTAVEIKGGQRSVELKYIPKGTIKNAILFFAAIIVVLLGFIIAKRKKFEPGKLLCKLSKIAFAAVFAFTMLIIYVLPLIAQVYMAFT